MKIHLIYIFCILYFCSCYTNKNIGNSNHKAEFKAHLNKLDSAAKIYPGDTVFCCSNSISFMVENTNVKIQTKPTFHGFLFFTKTDLVQWHKFYMENIVRQKLK